MSISVAQGGKGVAPSNSTQGSASISVDMSRRIARGSGGGEQCTFQLHTRRCASGKACEGWGGATKGSKGLSRGTRGGGGGHVSDMSGVVAPAGCRGGRRGGRSRD